MGAYDLDHIALAAADTSDALRFLTGQLGGTVIFGGRSYGFRPMQVWVGDESGDGMPIELIEPWLPERNDFLARFVARHGAGPHHLTFKVPDLVATIERMRSAGFSPVNIDLTDPDWKEAFVMPREAHGTVVQLAQTTHDFGTRAEHLAHVRDYGPRQDPKWWVDPEPSTAPLAKLRRVVLRTPSVSSALGLFGGLLRGEVVEESETFTELIWPGGARLRLVADGEGAPGVDRLEIEGLTEPITLIGTRFAPASSYS
jgi:methylmalonyl-CoA/ethylmalonyl-CoA epimerase